MSTIYPQFAPGTTYFSRKKTADFTASQDTWLADFLVPAGTTVKVSAYSQTCDTLPCISLFPRQLDPADAAAFNQAVLSKSDGSPSRLDSSQYLSQAGGSWRNVWSWNLLGDTVAPHTPEEVALLRAANLKLAPTILADRVDFRHPDFPLSAGRSCVPYDLTHARCANEGERGGVEKLVYKCQGGGERKLEVAGKVERGRGTIGEAPVTEGYGRSGGVGGGGGLAEGLRRPDPEVAEKAQRRRFTAEYKLGILEAADSCREPGEVGALLRREGLYAWRRQRRMGALDGLSPNKRGRKLRRSAEAKRIEHLEREVSRLREELRKAHVIIDVQKKVSHLLGISEAAESDEGS